MASEILLTRDQLCAMLMISDTSRQRLEKNDPSFPPKLHLGMRKVAYRRADVIAWLEQQRQAALNTHHAAA
ncbi:AlpA family phage regulatory protein [Mesorhizobium sp. M1E.F.Ca.ET.045.02.1.1]|uniref:helix-turn-helix transcriptional regulator n=1 Tax=Mesorhizobium sp. M1E.F.Ca.ET.045.02.1.1 TaxID=2493672 RepID=UPI000F75038C|nr:AlpA family phage regulatory protein [Mesorhizobium sp. M1E.F.Ca.ET.045.02.1.1]AZO24790.1 AlpA family phage regulatory protein [Mesorhizobium sp. M1E.F.Ca.ET.045.02.1.1]